MLKIEDLQKLDKPFDKGIFDQAFSKVKNFELGKMKHLQGEIRESFTDSVSNFLANATKLTGLKVSEFVWGSAEVSNLVAAIKQQEYINLKELDILG